MAEMIGAWTSEQRMRLSAVRRPGSEPEGFFFDAESAWRAVGGSGSVPTQLSITAEIRRARGLALARGTISRSFSDSYWNPLVALWLHTGGWELVLDLVLPRPADPWRNDLGGVSPAMGWIAMRRYLHASSPRDWRLARKRVEGVLANSDPALAEPRSYVAFAFDRDADDVHRLLRAFVDRGSALGDLGVLAGATTDSELLLAAVKKSGGIPRVDFVFDMVEGMGARALPVLELMGPIDPRAQKLLAEARALCVALAAA